jgi:hypothetical protein
MPGRDAYLDGLLDLSKLLGFRRAVMLARVDKCAVVSDEQLKRALGAVCNKVGAETAKHEG